MRSVGYESVFLFMELPVCIDCACYVLNNIQSLLSASLFSLPNQSADPRTSVFITRLDTRQQPAVKKSGNSHWRTTLIANPPLIPSLLSCPTREAGNLNLRPHLRAPHDLLIKLQIHDLPMRIPFLDCITSLRTSFSARCLLRSWYEDWVRMFVEGGDDVELYDCVLDAGVERRREGGGRREAVDGGVAAAAITCAGGRDVDVVVAARGFCLEMVVAAGVPGIAGFCGSNFE